MAKAAETTNTGLRGGNPNPNPNPNPNARILPSRSGGLGLLGTLVRQGRGDSCLDWNVAQPPISRLNDMAPKAAAQVGDRVRKTFEDGRAYVGTLISLTDAGRYPVIVKYDDGDVESYSSLQF